MREMKSYSEAFKLKVISDLESGRFHSHGEAREHYGITGNGTLTNWLKKYGKSSLIPRKVRIESLNEKDRIKELKERIRRLEKALASTKVDHVMSEAYFQVVCEEHGITDVSSYKKKIESKLSK